MLDKLKFNFQNVSDEGFAVLPPGRYEVTTGNWSAVEKETGNIVLMVNLIVAEDDVDFAGESVAYFQTLMPGGPAEKVRTSHRFFLRMLNALGVISSDDRGPNGELDVELIPGEKNEETGRVQIEGVEVNGEARKLTGYKALAVVVKNNKTQTGVSIDRLEPIAGAGNAPTSPSTKRPAEDDVPF